MKASFLIGNLMVLCCTLSLECLANPGNSKVKLLSVFSCERSPQHKVLLKLYEDKSFEYLEFKIIRSKAYAYRETGVYKLGASKLKIYKRKKNSRLPKKYYLLSSKGLYISRQKMRKGDASPDLIVDNDTKYHEPFFTDPVFGRVSNSKSASNKLACKELKEDQSLRTKAYKFNGDEYYKKHLNAVIHLSNDSLKKIKAVIVVGADESGNIKFIEEQSAVAAFLKKWGVNVIELYYPNAKWNDVKAASEGANIFIYSGHGAVLGEAKQGILYLNEGIIYGQEILEGLKLHRNALVIFNHACSSAGSSAGDKGDIGINEATRRVEDYAKVFIPLKIGCYYANNYYESVIPFLISFLNGMAVNKIYKMAIEENLTIALTKPHKLDSRYETSVAVTKLAGIRYLISTDSKGNEVLSKLPAQRRYSVAYVGLPNFTVKDFFK